MSVQVQHLQSKQESFETVKNFKFNNLNRTVRPDHVDELIRSIYDKTTGQWNMLQEITVNKQTGNICDGQHRTSGWIGMILSGRLPETSKLSVHYVSVAPEDEIEFITEFQKAKHWTYKTHIESAMKGGNTNFINLDRWCRQHSLCHKVNRDGSINCSYRYAAAILTGKGNRKLDGKFVITPEMEANGNILHDELVDIISILGYTASQANIEALAPAWNNWRNKNTGISFSDWKNMMKRKKTIRPNTNSSIGQRSWEDYFATIYGHML